MGVLLNKRVEQNDTFMLPRTVLVIGLGNIGDTYTFNRHNIGFLSLEAFAASENDIFTPWSEKKKLQALICTGKINDTTVILAQPTTMMNLSGQATQALAAFYRVDPECVIVLHDDTDPAFGTIRARLEGGSGGHNGLKSIIATQGEGFARIRVGVANEYSDKQDTADFVLSNFSKSERESFNKLFTVTNTLVNSFIAGALEETTTQF